MKLTFLGPYYLCEEFFYPPIVMIMGEEDVLFDCNSHMFEFGKKLQEMGVDCEMMAVKGKGHAFDIWAESGGNVQVNVLRPNIEWISQFIQTKPLL